MNMVDLTKYKKEEYEYVYCVVYLPMNMVDPTKNKKEEYEYVYCTYL